LKITAQFTGVISTGEFENERPLFALEEEFSGRDVEVKNRQMELYDICRGLFDIVQKESTIKKIQQLKEGIRFYPPENYVSVTSVIGWDDDQKYKVTPEELIQYGSRGSIIHKLAEVYAKTKKWEKPEDVPECYPDLVILNSGSLNLSLDGYNLPAFLEKHPIKFLSTETVVKNHEHKYAGRQDAKGIYENKKTLVDYKTGDIDERKCFKQLTAYWRCPENEDVEQIMVVPLRPTHKTKQGYSKPIICDNKEKYWSLFLRDRESFKKRFNI